MRLIVDDYVRLTNRQALEDLRSHREKLLTNMTRTAAFEMTLPSQQLADEIAAIDEGLARLETDVSSIESARERSEVVDVKGNVKLGSH